MLKHSVNAYTINMHMKKKKKEYRLYIVEYLLLGEFVKQVMLLGWLVLFFKYKTSTSTQ